MVEVHELPSAETKTVQAPVYDSMIRMQVYLIQKFGDVLVHRGLAKSPEEGYRSWKPFAEPVRDLYDMGVPLRQMQLRLGEYHQGIFLNHLIRHRGHLSHEERLRTKSSNAAATLENTLDSIIAKAEHHPEAYQASMKVHFPYASNWRSEGNQKGYMDELQFPAYPFLEKARRVWDLEDSLRSYSTRQDLYPQEILRLNTLQEQYHSALGSVGFDELELASQFDHPLREDPFRLPETEKHPALA